MCHWNVMMLRRSTSNSPRIKSCNLRTQKTYWDIVDIEQNKQQHGNIPFLYVYMDHWKPVEPKTHILGSPGSHRFALCASSLRRSTRSLHLFEVVADRHGLPAAKQGRQSEQRSSGAPNVFCPIAPFGLRCQEFLVANIVTSN